MNARLFRALIGATLLCCFGAAASAQTSPADLASLREKAEDGNAIAQYNLGLIYADATEPAHDLIEAYVWLNHAASNGARGRQLNLVAERLNNEQLAEANRRLGQPIARPRPVTAAAPSSISRAPLEANQTALNQLQAERDQPATELEQLRAQLARSQSTSAGTSADLRKRVAIAETALSNRDTATAALKAEIAQLRSAGPSPAETALRTERDQFAIGARTAAAELAALRVAAVTSRQEIGSLNTQITAQQAETQGLRAQLDQAGSATGNLTAATRRIQNLLAELGEARQLTDLLQTQVDDDDASLGERTTQEQALRDEVARLSADLNTTRLAQTTAATALAANEARLRALDSIAADLAAEQAEAQRLADEVASLSTQLNAARSSSGDLTMATGRIQNLLAELGEARQQNEALQLQANDSTAALTTAEDRLNELQSVDNDLAAATARLEIFSTELNSARQRLQTSETQINELSSDLAASRASLAQVRRDQASSGDAAAAQLTTVETELATARETISALETELDSARSRGDLSAQLAADLDYQSNKFETAFEERDELQLRLNDADHQIAALTGDLTTARANITRIRQTQAATGDDSAAELAALSAQLETAENQSAERASQLSALQSERDLFAQEVAALESSTADHNASLAQANATIAQLTAQLEDTRTTTDPAIANAQAELAGLASEHNTLTEELTTLRDQNAELLVEIDTLRSARPAAVATAPVDEGVQRRLDASLRAFAVQEREMTRLREQFDDASSRADAADAILVSLRDELSGLQTAMAELQTEAGNNAERAVVAESSSSETEAVLADLQEQLTDSQAVAAERDQQLADLRRQLNSGNSTSTDLTAQNASLREEARLAREQTAALARDFNALRARAAVTTTTPSAAPGRSAPSRPSATTPTFAPAVSFPPPTTPLTEPTTSFAPPAASPSPAPRPATTAPQRHTIMPGETLSRIARDFYGDGNRWPEILAANRDVIPEPNFLRVGTPIVIP